jgi:hypothetical protein
MRQFLSGTDKAFHELEERAKRACIRFRDQEMPLGSVPERADIGFEVDQHSGSAKLLVNKGIRYSGLNPAVREWFSSGIKEFPTFDKLKEWIRGSLADSFRSSMATGDHLETGGPATEQATQLTDMSVIHEAVKKINRPVYLDEERLVSELSKRVLGQDGALRALSAVVVRHCARLRPSRPAVTFATGPSGVGKTRTAESLAAILRDLDSGENGYGFLRLDMTEYQEAHRVSQLIGAPQGYIGHGEGSQFGDALRGNPRMIVLFDEIEKAHPAILRVLMNVLDAGRLSTSTRSSTGREIDCRHAVFMFTSNLESKETLNELENRNGFGNRAVEDEVCRRRFHATGIPPEIVGRIERFLVFRPLSPETRAEIVALAVAEVATEYGVDVAYVHPNVIIDLMKRIRSDDFGVRPERFLIDDVLGGAFAKAAEKQIPNPVEVLGPPYRCETHSNLDDSNRGHNSESEQITLEGGEVNARSKSLH